MYFIVCQLYFNNINEREKKKGGGLYITSK